MKRDKRCPLLGKEIKGERIYQSVTAQEAGWEFINFHARIMDKGETWGHHTGDNEIAIVLLGGNFVCESEGVTYRTGNGRKDVFSGLPHCIYLSRNKSFTLTAESDVLDIAVCECPTEMDYPTRFITPDDVVEMGIEHRGGDNASRQINRMLPPGSPCQRIVCVEVYTPEGNWSSFPAHKHDVRRVTPEGTLIEADLEEVYFYKIDKPTGFALQKVYTDDRSLDEIAEPHNNDIVLVPRGYHPVSAAPGYNCYYLNFLAGTDQALNASDDPDHKWYYNQWKRMDERVPMVTREMNG